MQSLWKSYMYALTLWGQTDVGPSQGGVASLNGFNNPPSAAVDQVNPMVGNGGDSPNGSGGMIPSVAPPFGMTRWVAQTRENYVSVTPYNNTDMSIHGFQGTHQPAIWMGESGQAVVVPGFVGGPDGKVKTAFEERGLAMKKETEKSTVSYYSIELEDGSGNGVFAEISATSRVGHLRFTFSPDTDVQPLILLEATRATTLFSSTPTSSNTSLAFPSGSVSIDPSAREISGHNPERQDAHIGPISQPATGFAGYFVARFDTPFEFWGTATNGTTHRGETQRNGNMLSGYAAFPANTSVVNVRVGVSFISVDQARANLESEIPDGQTLEGTAFDTRSAWAEKLDRIQVEGATEANLTTFYTAVFHTLQYPYEQDEGGRYYSGYDDSVHSGASYTGYSNWDTFRAQWAWLILLAPERIPGMITSMLQDFQEGGWLPMWKNIVETNIMVGTHADSLVAEAVVKGFGSSFNTTLAAEAVYKDATVPPVDDLTVSYFDREEHVDYEVRAGLSSIYEEHFWVAADVHSESASRTLDFAYDDFAVGTVLSLLNFAPPTGSITPAELLGRSRAAPKTIFNNDTTFMEARNANGSFAGPEEGWTEGDMWCYTFDDVHDVPGLIALIGGTDAFVKKLDEHFDGGHNDQTNEPSHHIPYLYSLAGAASRTQERLREIAVSNYNDSVNGLSGNEDCGQMSAWYIFSALGFYPVNPVSGQYVIGTPFFDKVTIQLPNADQPLVISSSSAPTKPYIQSITLNGKALDVPTIDHADIVNGGNITFDMSNTPQPWGSATLAAERRELGESRKVVDEL